MLANSRADSGPVPSVRSVKYPLPPYTLIGATTRLGLLTGPLRARFGVTHLLEPYAVAELECAGPVVSRGKPDDPSTRFTALVDKLL